VTPASDPRRPARPVERALPPPAPDTAFESGLYLPLDQIEIAVAGGAAAVLNGNLAVSWVDSTFDGALDADDQLESARAGVALRGAATLELALDAGADVAGLLRLAMIPLPPIAAGPSIEISPFVEVRLHLAGSADADARISVVAPFRLGSGFAFDGALRAGMSSSPRHEPEIGLPDSPVALAGSVDLELLVALLIAIEGVPVGGPVIGTSLGTIVDVDPIAGVALEGAVEIVGGWAFLGLDGLPDIPEDLVRLHPLVRFEIPSPGGPFAGLAPTRWSRLFDIDSDDGAAAVLPAGAGATVIEDRGFPWMATLDGAGVPIWQSTAAVAWSPVAMVHAADGDLLAAGVSFTAIRVDRFSPSGEPRWTRTIRAGGADRTTCVAVVPRSSGGAVLAGEVTRSGVRSALMIAIDDAGAVEWAIEVDAGGGSTNPAIAALAEAPTGDIIAVGEVDHTDLEDPSLPPIDRQNALILRLRPDGTQLTGFALGGTEGEKASRVAVARDGSYAIGGHLGRAPNVWLASLHADDRLRWSASYRSRPHASGVDFTNLTGLAAIPSGLLACGHMEPPGVDAWLIRVDAEGMPVWSKTYIGADSTDEPAGVAALADGLVMCGRTEVKEDVSTHGDLWVVRTNVDGMLHFLADSGLACQCTAAEWRRLPDHTTRALAPTAVPATLDVDAEVELQTNPATAFGELLTD
jgi:hypothetical protein